MATNISWKDNITNIQLYRGITKISEVVKQRRLRLAGHCIRNTDELALNLMLWNPKNGLRNRGRQSTTLIDILKSDCD